MTPSNSDDFAANYGSYQRAYARSKRAVSAARANDEWARQLGDQPFEIARETAAKLSRGAQVRR